MRKIYSLVFGGVFAMATIGLLSHAAQAAVILNTSNGQLIGAQNVDVQGTLYDVSFVDGTCIDIYSGCTDAASNFTFTDFDSAFAAGTALLEQVFLDTVEGLFGSRTELTQGCESLVTCFSVIPYSLRRSAFDAVVAENLSSDGTERVFVSNASPAFDLTILDNNTFAVFSLASGSPAEIDEPSTLLLFGVAMLALGTVCRRKQRAAELRHQNTQEAC
ncbi:PEP-CTERM sorting domain-containing protein [Pelagibius sp. Alg239-R121]|uniref:PEP-CTERM sorting domain-containing protein n=1 Tax=Pelagibius sp. Alg239-R121 TaxID=2993448 RepID=UPI0024A6115F|nr:PEP-CTERM sorting domain-containing protein [Pelagibius sp. Alg239-R121]